MSKHKALKGVAPVVLLKLDLGCGKNKAEGFIGVDSLALPGVDTVADLRQRWPWADGSVEEVRCSHFLEHLTSGERTHFANELYRVLWANGKAQIITPHWTHACAYGDPTHQWPPVSEWAFQYWNRSWREAQAPHTDKKNFPGGYDCDFDWTIGFSWDPWLEARNNEMKAFAMQRYVNSSRDLVVNLTKR
jgi:hypothetical protein